MAFLINKRAKLFFNPKSGSNSSRQFFEIIQELQCHGILAEPYLITPDCNTDSVVKEALIDGISLFIVCGGDGTVASLAESLCHSNATLAVIPTGTQNNIALSLNIPLEIPQAIALIKNGKEKIIDMGKAQCQNKTFYFMEVCSAGLFSTLFSSGDEIQHGNLLRIGDFLSTLVSSEPSKFRLVLEENEVIEGLAHAILFTNMPYIGRNSQVGSNQSFRDGMLDILVCSDCSKLKLLNYALLGGEIEEDLNIARYQASRAELCATPSMTVMADGVVMGQGTLMIESMARALKVIAGASIPFERKEVFFESQQV